MANFQNISEELREIAPVVANLCNNNPYTVPMGYFDGLAGNILEQICPEQHIAVSKEQPYSIPAGYFNNLADSILNKINAKTNTQKSEAVLELELIAPLLNTINRENIFFVTVGYFESFGVNIPLENKPPKVIPIGSTVRKWLTYAAAASVLFVLSTASYLYVNQHSKNIKASMTIEQRLANLGDEEIFNYINNDLGDYDPANTNLIEQDPDIDHMIINASDAEIERYLDAESTDTGEENIKGI